MNEASPCIDDARSCRICGVRGLGAAVGLDEEIPPLGLLIRISNQSLRFLGIATDRLVLASKDPPFALFLVPDANGVPGLIERARFAELLRSGEAEVLPAVRPVRSPSAEEATTIAAERLMVECEMLDAAGVPQGTKAIDIFIHDHWSDDLRARFGEPDNPHTIRR